MVVALTNSLKILAILIDALEPMDDFIDGAKFYT